MRLKALTTVVTLATAPTALAQDMTDDWSLFTDARAHTTMAYTDYSNGVGLAVRCVDGAYEGLISGLPAAQGTSRFRLLTLQFGEDEPDEEAFFVASEPTIAVSRLPMPMARKLRLGGQLQITVPGGGTGGRNLRHVLNLPTSSAAIDQTLTACGKPLVDPRDAIVDPDLKQGNLPDGIIWARPPRPSYPSTNYAEGYVLMTCVSQPDGALTDCEAESEFPFDQGFARAALRSTRRARIGRSTGSTVPLATGRIRFSINFALGPDRLELPPTPTRIRPDPREN